MPNPHSSPVPTCLSPCPDSPNCVSSLAAQDSRHYISALIFERGPEQAFKTLLGVLKDLPRSTLIRQEPTYLHLECRSRLFGFVDDLEFCWDDAHRLYHVRSASRLGYYDFGVNRRRVERIRASLAGR